MNRREAAVQALEACIGHVFTDRELLERALTHASVGDGAMKVRHNERLEFLGDRVLNLLAAEQLMDRQPAAREGEMSPLMNELVSSHACARVARRIGLAEALRMAASATKIGGRDNDTVLGDACEALMAALYIDAGLEGARRFFDTFWVEEFERLDGPRVKDPKTQLQEWAQGLGRPLPAYRVVGQDGPAHEPRFRVEVVVEGVPPEVAEGRSKQDAQKAAALAMLTRHQGST
jgi:ribonuclease-3